MSTVFVSPTRDALLVANAAWFGAGFVQFTLKAHQTFTKGITREPGGLRPTHAEHGADAFRYLGAINAALSLSVISQLYKLWTTRPYKGDVVLTFLYGLWGAAHASQAITTLAIVAPSKRWHWGGLKGLGMITYVDLFLWIADWLVWWRG